MTFTDDERRRNVEALRDQVETKIAKFFEQVRDIDQGFSEEELVLNVSEPKFDRHAATRYLMDAKARGAVHRMSGRWHVGPMPPENTAVDQA